MSVVSCSCVNKHFQKKYEMIKGERKQLHGVGFVMVLKKLVFRLKD